MPLPAVPPTAHIQEPKPSSLLWDWGPPIGSPPPDFRQSPSLQCPPWGRGGDGLRDVHSTMPP